MTYNGKKVITKEAFSYEDVHIGDYVEQSIVDDADRKSTRLNSSHSS